MKNDINSLSHTSWNVTIHSQNIHRLWEIMKKILIIFYYEGKSSTICIESTVIKDERNIVRKTTKNSR